MAGAGRLLAQMTAVIPPAAEGVAGSSANSIPIGNLASGTFQVMYSADQMAAIPIGSTITAMQLRLRNTATTAYPPTARNLSKYEVRFGTSTATPATMTTAFASNMSGTVAVRMGATTINANDCPAGNSGTIPEDWSSPIAFSTSYVYNGGPLVVEIRTDTAATITSHFADLYVTSGKAAFVSSSSSTATSGASVVSNQALVMRLTFTPPSWELAHGVTKVTVLEEGVSGPTLSWSEFLATNTPKTVMTVVAQEQFDTLAPGSRIVGMTWRNRTNEVWPSATANYSTFSIQMGHSLATPASASEIFAGNFAPGSIITRGGGLSVPMHSFPPMPTFAVNPFGYEVAFSNPFEYVHGPLAWVVRHSGQPLEVGVFDSQQVGQPWYGTKVRSFYAEGMSATTAAGQAGADITRLSIDAGAASPLGSVGPGADAFGIEVSPVLQTIIAASELRHIPPGSVIDSLWLRQIASAPAGPAANVMASDFEVYLSTAARRPQTISITFAANEGSDRVLVHDGQLNVPAGSLPSGADGRFGKIVQFKRNFVYKGGDVCVTVRHMGLSGPLGEPEATVGTASINRSTYSFTVGASEGSLYGGAYTGTAMRLGYIPSVMTPNSLATMNGSGGWTMFGQTAYTVQVIIAADQLRSMDVGSVINGLSLRQGSASNLVSLPSVARTVPRFDVKLSPANRTPLAMSDTFTDNIGIFPRDVRTGPLTVPMNAFPTSGDSGTPSENAWYVPFDIGYVYRGGDLCVTIRGEGVVSASGWTDGEGNVPNARGATRYRYGDSDATSGLPWGPPAIRLAFTARTFCPSDLNKDGSVDDADFSLFVQAYDVLDCGDVSMAFGCPSDFTYDTIVDDSDFVVFIAAYDVLLCPY